MAQSRIVIFCGKGGVGKTTLSLAFGLHHAAAGRKVVIVSSHPLPELAVAVSLDGLHARWPAAESNLFIVHLDAKELLAEVVEKNFPVQFVARAILASSIYQNLIEVAPGLKEFYFLARLQQLAERKSPDHSLAQYDLLLWDAPATGHFLSTLRAARSFETYLTGPLASAGADLARFFSNASQIASLPVTTLEEMAVEETIEMNRTLERDYHLKPAALLLNLISPVAAMSDSELQDLKRAADASGDTALRFAMDRGVMERRRAEQLRKEIEAPAVAVERIGNYRDDLDLLDRIGAVLKDLPV